MGLDFLGELEEEAAYHLCAMADGDLWGNEG